MQRCELHSLIERSDVAVSELQSLQLKMSQFFIDSEKLHSTHCFKKSHLLFRYFFRHDRYDLL